MVVETKQLALNLISTPQGGILTPPRPAPAPAREKGRTPQEWALFYDCQVDGKLKAGETIYILEDGTRQRK